jgi:radical SAM superfamily enzyme YgiQ (UPF0313 family)
MGCNFCTTSAFFGGKGRYLNFYDSGEEIFQVMSRMESRLGVKSFFMMDENFLLHKRRALELLELMKAGGKAWALYVFSSANAIRQYSMRELVELGVSWIWMGLESPRSGYTKLNGADTLALTRELREHGIKLLGSTIIGLEHHTPENIGDEIDHAVRHDTDFHQFMLYTPVPGTPLFFEMQEQGRMLPEIDLADIHGQHEFNFRHAALSKKGSKRWLDHAFRRDFERNGPSIYRICRTTLEGWKRYKDDPDARVRARFTREARSLRDGYAAALWAMERHLRRTNAAVADKVHALGEEIAAEFGLRSRIASAVLGPLLLWSARREERRLAAGFTYEPKPIVERRNWTAGAVEQAAPPAAVQLAAQEEQVNAI